MEPSRFVCWEPEAVSRAINTIAGEVAPHYFLATHHAMKMRRRTRHGVETALLTQEEFRDLFLAGDYMLAAVLGVPGTGKSHLIQWLATMLPNEAHKHVVQIPRAGTNLRRVIELILGNLPGARFDEYRDRLRRAASELQNPERTRRQLLNQIAVEVSSCSTLAGERLSDPESEARRHRLMRDLPDLLALRPFRERLSVVNGTLDRLAHHVMGDTGEEITGNRRGFTEAELSVGEWGLTDRDIPAELEDTFASLAGDSSFRAAAVEWINLNLDAALAKLLGFGGEDLGTLLFDVRVALEADGCELILLIEDLTKTQGLDHQILEALLARNEQAGQRLCRLRAAVGITPEYFRTLRDNVRQRFELTVSLDIDAEGANGADPSDGLARFAARYLNAVRLPEEILVKWRGSLSALPESRREPVPNRCAACDYKEACRDTFGEQDGVSLYPFTPAALNTMVARATHGETRGGAFNPRLVLTEVLQPVLANYRQSLSEGDFPPASLLTQFGTKRMPPRQIAMLQQEVGDRWSQYQTLFELWGDPEKLSGVSPAVFKAFGLAPYQRANVIGPGPGLGPGPGPEPPPPPPPPPDNRFRERLDQLTEWSHGGILPAVTAQELRHALFTAVWDHIDWDLLGMEANFFAPEPRGRDQKVGENKPFNHNSFNFVNQETGGRLTSVRIQLPISGSLVDTALGLQGMVLFQQHRHWDFEGGGLYLRAYASLLDACAEEAVSQLRRFSIADGVQSPWDPSTAAAEALLITKRLQGVRGVGPEPVIDLLFRRPEPGPSLQRDESWSRLMQDLRAHEEALDSILRSHAGCNKGGDTGAVVDAARFSRSLAAVSRGWQLQAVVPSGLRTDFSAILEARSLIERRLPEAVRAERNRLLGMRTLLLYGLPRTERVASTASGVRKVFLRAANDGVWPGEHDREALLQLVAGLEQFDQGPLFDRLDALDSAATSADQLEILTDTEFVHTVERVADSYRRLTAALEAIQWQVQRDLNQSTSQTTQVEQDRQEIEESLKAILVIARNLGGDA